MLTVEKLNVSYGRAQVLFDVDLTLTAGSLMCVMGRNGVGKTTLLNAIMGVLMPRSGTVTFEGKDVTRNPVHTRVKAGMGYVPQGHETFPHLTVLENLQVTLEAVGGKKAVMDEALDLFPALKGMLKRRAGFLSGGQAQQLAIARALVTTPKLLILDEPTEGIQPSIIIEIEDAIDQLHRVKQLAVLVVEQYLEFALRLADSFVVLDAGEVAHSGEREDLGDEKVKRLLAV
jgi:urea transport system ATP-binding protein